MRIDSPPPRLPRVVPILNGQTGQNGQNGQNASEVRSLLDFFPWPFARHAEFEKDKNDKIALERATCACHLAHGEGVPTPLSSCRGAIDLVDDNRVYLADDYACYVCGRMPPISAMRRRVSAPAVVAYVLSTGCWPARSRFLSSAGGP